MPRFVLLEHDHPYLHWDFMLEVGDALWTWRLDRIPETAESIPAERLLDHRLHYLDYEGPVSGNRGSVKRIDRGDYERLTRDDACDFQIRLSGSRLRGTAIVDLGPGPEMCQFRWQPD